MDVGETWFVKNLAGDWLPVVIVWMDSAPWSDWIGIRWPDGHETKMNANLLLEESQ